MLNPSLLDKCQKDIFTDIMTNSDLHWNDKTLKVAMSMPWKAFIKALENKYSYPTDNQAI
jgi:hypothetical protein